VAVSIQPQVNVFEVGAIYLKLLRITGLPDIHPLDPAIYIHRFASLLEFGEDLENVKRDATNLVAGFRRDWMIEGRRPSGICGASLILAARMNNYRRSVAEVVQVVKIADSTIKKRLEEFQTTPAAQMSVAELRERWGKHDRKEEAFPAASAPPIFQKHRRIEALQEAASARAARRATSEARSEPSEDSTDEEHMVNGSTKRKRGQGTAKTQTRKKGRGLSPPPEASFGARERSASAGPGPNTQANALARLGEEGIEDEEEDDNDILNSAVLDEALGQDVQEALADNDVAEALQKIEHAKKEEMQSIQERIANEDEGDPLKGLDEGELDDYILDPIEAKIKMHTWIDTNMDYLVNLQGKHVDLFVA
jgi:transcription factor IIIB subunit 2